MATSQFLPFAWNYASNVQTQAQWEANPATLNGFSAGIARSRECNKAWRQAAAVAAGLTWLIPDVLNEDALDDGDRPKLSDQIYRLMVKVSRDNAEVQEAPLDGRIYGRQFAAWTPVPGEAPADNLTYGRLNNYWTRVVTWAEFTDWDAPAGAWYVRTRGAWGDLFALLAGAQYITDAPANGQIWGRQNNAWAQVASMQALVETQQQSWPVRGNTTIIVPSWASQFIFELAGGGGGGGYSDYRESGGLGPDYATYVSGGGGGAGGFASGQRAVTPGASINVVIGAGGGDSAGGGTSSVSGPGFVVTCGGGGGGFWGDSKSGNGGGGGGAWGDANQDILVTGSTGTYGQSYGYTHARGNGGACFWGGSGTASPATDGPASRSAGGPGSGGGGSVDSVSSFSRWPGGNGAGGILRYRFAP